MYWKRDLFTSPNKSTDKFLEQIMENRQLKTKEKNIHKIEGLEPA